MNMTAPTRLTPEKSAHGATVAGYARLATVTALAAWAGWLAVESYYRDQAKTTLTFASIEVVDPATAAALTKADRDTRIEVLRAKLKQNPLDDGALTEIALLLAANGQKSEADQLALLAAERSIRNVTAQLLALDTKVQRGEISSALTGIDGLIRSSPELSEKLFDQLFALAMATKDGQAQLVALLATNPPWRQAFITRVVASQAVASAIYSLLTDLKATEAPPSDVELRGFLARLINAKDLAGAYYLWLDMLSDQDLKRTGNVFDPSFDTQSRNLFFDWTFDRTKTVEVKVVPRATGSSDRIMRIDFIGNRDAAMPAYQYLRMLPGAYVFSGEQQSENLKTDSGLVWQIQCIDGGGDVLAQSPKLSGSTQWTRFDVRMTVPEGCMTQLLSLRAASGAKLDQQISGAVAYDNIVISDGESNE